MQTKDKWLSVNYCSTTAAAGQREGFEEQTLTKKKIAVGTHTPKSDHHKPTTIKESLGSTAHNILNVWHQRPHLYFGHYSHTKCCICVCSGT